MKTFHEENFSTRHIGPDSKQIAEMLSALSMSSLDEMTQKVVPENILTQQKFPEENPLSERQLKNYAAQLGRINKIFRSYIGQGYYGCLTPSVLKRNILENPGWYTAYTPYQSEIAQGRLEALLNFQTMVCELSGMQLANSSLLDEATAAAEAVSLCYSLAKTPQDKKLFIDKDIFQATKSVLLTRAQSLGISYREGDLESLEEESFEDVFAVFLQYPSASGVVKKFKTQKSDLKVIVAADLLSLTLLEPPGEWGADVVVGSTQRFGMPMGYGGPHAAYLATKQDYKRRIPGRLVGVSKDTYGKKSYRLSLQTREQHIRREKATSNICTSQVLPAVVASCYAVYHGQKGLKDIAQTVHAKTAFLIENLRQAGFSIPQKTYFDTFEVLLEPSEMVAVQKRALLEKINMLFLKDRVRLSLDETVTEKDLKDLYFVFTNKKDEALLPVTGPTGLSFPRKSAFLTHDVFNRYHSETEMMRYLHFLERKDLSLNHSMIPLGSCTMKLNAATEMEAITDQNWSHLHPFAPIEQAKGYEVMIGELEEMLKILTGFSAISFQPNAGSQGEYAGLLAIRQYHESRKEPQRNLCLIPSSAHGTNPSSAILAGMKVVVIQCKSDGSVDMSHLKTLLGQYKHEISTLMLTYPSTHGVFEEDIKEVCRWVHEYGGQVYMDGANFNAMVGLCRPVELGCDVAHFNLHKTFCIPHGGGGPGMGPIGVAEHLKEYLPSHDVVSLGFQGRPVSQAPWGSASILLISWAYCRMMGFDGFEKGLSSGHFECELFMS